MKTFVLAAAMTALATTAFAGGMAEPVEMPMVDIVDDTTAGTSQGLIVPLIIVALIAAAVAAND